MAISNGSRIHFRMPVVPTINDDVNNIAATAQFIKELQRHDANIELMPYHRLGIGKYQALERIYPLEQLRSPGLEQVENTRNLFEKLGVRCLISK